GDDVTLLEAGLGGGTVLGDGGDPGPVAVGILVGPDIEGDADPRSAGGKGEDPGLAVILGGEGGGRQQGRRESGEDGQGPRPAAVQHGDSPGARAAGHEAGPRWRVAGGCGDRGP